MWNKISRCFFKISTLLPPSRLLRNIEIYLDLRRENGVWKRRVIENKIALKEEFVNDRAILLRILECRSL